MYGAFFMEIFEINGKNKLFGEVKINSAKNAVLPIIAGSILCDKPIVVQNVPRLIDVYKMCEILRFMGSKVIFEENILQIDNSMLNRFELPSALSHELRSSIFMMGPLLAKYKTAVVPYPGGCDIGSRPIDLHISGLKSLNVKIEEEAGLLHCDGRCMKSGFVHLDFPSVGATENILMASVFLKGTTTISNAAKEPEIVDLANFINKMGGKVRGAGTSTIKITGVKKLNPVEYIPIADRIEAGTFLLATSICKGKVTLKKANAEHIFSLIIKMRDLGCQISFDCDNIYVQNNIRLPSISSVDTQPYPGFPTDLQAPLLAFLSTCRGVSVVTENLYENRFSHAFELNKMGAKIITKGRSAIVEGVEELSGSEVNAHDLRAGAGLVIAGLNARGKTLIKGVEFIDRGYYQFEEKLRLLGGDIQRKIL